MLALAKPAAHRHTRASDSAVHGRMAAPGRHSAAGGREEGASFGKGSDWQLADRSVPRGWVCLGEGDLSGVCLSPQEVEGTSASAAHSRVGFSKPSRACFVPWIASIGP